MSRKSYVGAPSQHKLLNLVISLQVSIKNFQVLRSHGLWPAGRSLLCSPRRGRHRDQVIHGWHERATLSLPKAWLRVSTGARQPCVPASPGRSPSGKELLELLVRIFSFSGLSPWGKAPCLLFTVSALCLGPNIKCLFSLSDHTFT